MAHIALNGHSPRNQEEVERDGFSGGAVVKKPLANARDAKDTGLIPGLGRSPREEMATCPSILPGNLHGR